MKRVGLILILCISYIAVTAQNEVDALRYSLQMPVGTARAVGLGGAVGALGADFTALSVNPAGLGLYRSSEITFSPSVFWDKTSSSFLGNSYEETKHNLNVGSYGFVTTYDNNRETGWVSASFAFGYNRTANFNRNVLMSGTNTSNSLLDNFTDNANNNNFDAFYEQLAYDVLLLPFDSISDPNEYWNDIQEAGYGQLQRRLLNTRGSSGEYTFSFGANYSHKLYLGATLGITRLRYEQDVIHLEEDITGNEEDITGNIDFFESFIFRENLRTNGTGLNFKLGAIVRPVDMLRVGIAYHLPTFYTLNDRFTTDMEALLDPYLGYDKQTAYSPIGEYDYKLQTPSKFVGSITVTIGKMGLLSMDYERVDYSKAKLSASDYDFFTENGKISSDFKAANNLRMGGELRLGTAYLRGGYSFYQSPYVTVDPGINPNLNTFSAGLGMRSRFFYLDFGYSVSNMEEVYYMYIPQMTEGSRNKSIGNNMILTLGYKF